MDYKDPNSECVLQDLLIVTHQQEGGDDLRQIMMTLEAEKFDMTGHTGLKLEHGIYQSYLQVYRNKKKAREMVDKNK